MEIRILNNLFENENLKITFKNWNFEELKNNGVLKKYLKTESVRILILIYRIKKIKMMGHDHCIPKVAPTTFSLENPI